MLMHTDACIPASSRHRSPYFSFNSAALDTVIVPAGAACLENHTLRTPSDTGIRGRLCSNARISVRGVTYSAYSRRIVSPYCDSNCSAVRRFAMLQIYRSFGRRTESSSRNGCGYTKIYVGFHTDCIQVVYGLCTYCEHIVYCIQILCRFYTDSKLIVYRLYTDCIPLMHADAYRRMLMHADAY